MATKHTLFIYPTDTVWGIGASIYDQWAHQDIAAIKRTSPDKPLSIMFTNLATLKKTFSFPAEMTDEWLIKFFTMETTLGLELSSALSPIPAWVYGQSDMVSIRYSANSLLKTIPEPFFSTSLNLTGEPPITTYKEAVQFQKDHASEALVLGSEKDQLSGESSTIVFFRNKGFKIIRAGRNVDDIKSHLSLTGFPCA